MRRLALLLLLLGVTSTGCGAANKVAIRVAESWPSVQMGMSKSEVLGILGEPTSRSTAYDLGWEHDCWNYSTGSGHHYQVCFSNGAAEPHHALVVFAKNHR